MCLHEQYYCFSLSFYHSQLNYWKAKLCEGMWMGGQGVHAAGFLGKLNELQKVSKNMCCPLLSPSQCSCLV